MEFDPTKKLVCDKCMDVADTLHIDNTRTAFSVMGWDTKLNKYIVTVKHDSGDCRIRCGRCGCILLQVK